jgi:hypothetical protein
MFPETGLPEMQVLGNPAKPRSYRPGFLQGYLPPTDWAGIPYRGSGLCPFSSTMVGKGLYRWEAMTRCMVGLLG